MQFKVIQNFKHASLKTVDSAPTTLVLEATAPYIPIEQFKEIFNFIGDVVKRDKINKLVFDKQKLTVFHQPSMEWYFVEWKEKMFDLGLKTHRKILPQDDVFRQSVRIGREKIKNMFPDGKYNQMDIQYADSVEDAIHK